MLSFLKIDPVTKLKKQYQQKLKKAMEAQRSGNTRLYSELVQEADQLINDIETLNANN